MIAFVVHQFETGLISRIDLIIELSQQLTDQCLQDCSQTPIARNSSFPGPPHQHCYRLSVP